MLQMLWKPDRFKIATRTKGVGDVAGYTYKGLGMRCHMRGSPKGRRPPWWNLTHLNSGHKVVSLHLHDAHAFDVATQIADLSDWDFETLDGWKNRDPALRDKVASLLSTIGHVKLGGPDHDEKAAREIALSRL